MKLKDLKTDQVILCKTQNQARLILQLAKEEDIKWGEANDYDNTKWQIYESITCYRLRPLKDGLILTFENRAYFESSGFEILASSLFVPQESPAPCSVLRDALEKKLNFEMHPENNDKSHFYNMGLKTALRVVDEALSSINDGWISVEDGLPDIDKWVLLHNGKWTGVGKRNNLEEDDHFERMWQDETQEYIANPTHWKPLPQPPVTK